MTNRSNPTWDIWIDTGGTFTDCLARNPDEQLVRLKILSSSVLRGKVKRIHTTNVVQVDIAWPCKEDIFEGFTFSITGTSYSASIDRIDISQNLIYLHKPLGKTWTNSAFEITSHEEVPVLAVRLITLTGLRKKFPPHRLRLGSTRGTNAMLERKGARTALLITKGFKDLLVIGNQQRPDLFALHVIKSLPLYDCVFELEERIASDGTVLHPPVQSELESISKALKGRKINSVAVAFLNSYKNPIHEILATAYLKSEGFQYVSASHQLSSQIRILTRAETTVANAYLDPIIHSYVSGIQNVLSGATINIMNSAGSLVKSDSFYPKDSLLSGPAGGVVGAARQAELSGIKK